MNSNIYKYFNKIIKFSVISSFLLLFTSCPSNQDCNDIDSISRVNDLITLLPEQTEYTQGDIVTLKLDIPATNTFFGNEINFFDETGDDRAHLLLTWNQLFLDNEITIIKGSQAEAVNRFFFPYNPLTDAYDLEVQIKLNRIGFYSFGTDESVEFDGGGCNRYFIDTNILWSVDREIQFIVNE